MAAQYYCLVAGLREYALDADNKGFDADSIKEEVYEAVSGKDAAHVRLLYTFYDIGNIVGIKTGRGSFNTLGNFSAEELEEQVKKPDRLPRSIACVLEAYTHADNTDHEDIDTGRSLERSLFDAYYAECAKSKCRFLREWYAFDRDLRNIGAAYTARRTDLAVGEVVVGGGYVAEQLSKSSAADFGLKGEVDYMDRIAAAVDDGGNLIDKERRIDLVRWRMSDEIAAFDYFNIDRVLSHLVKVNIVHRWAALDEKTGREMFDRLMRSLDAGDVIDGAGQQNME